eukprot:UN01737
MTESDVRAKAAKNFGDILQGEPYGQALEKRIWSFSNGDRRVYANRIREILFTLRGNAEIKQKVLNGEISLKRLAKMSTEDLASSELTKTKRAAKETMQQIIVKKKHFLGKRGDTLNLLSERNDIEHEDPEFNRQVDSLDISLVPQNYEEKSDWRRNVKNRSIKSPP